MINCTVTESLIYKAKLINNKFAMCFVLIVCFFGCSKDSDIDLIINNSGDTSIFDVSIKDSLVPFIKEIKSGESKVIKLKPSGESHLDVRYINVKKEVKTVKGGYFEGKRYKGKITIIIGNNDETEVDENIEIF